MKTITIESTDPSAMAFAKGVIESGGLIAFPTDTVYGLSSSPFSEEAIQKIFAAKGRDFNKAIAILFGKFDQLPGITTGFTPPARTLADRFWPGALTLVVPIAPVLPGIISPYATIGIRMPNHPFALSLLTELGPLATTSANISGKPDASTAAQVESQLGKRIDLIIDGGTCPGGVPSTVVDCTLAQIRILRQGAISSTDIENVLGLEPGSVF